MKTKKSTTARPSKPKQIRHAAERPSDGMEPTAWDQVPRNKWNKWFIRLQEYCAVKPNAVEDHPWGEVVFKVRKKIFASLGLPNRGSVTVKATDESFDRLLKLSYVNVAPYVGRFGWVVISVTGEKEFKTAQAAIDKSYDQVAPKPPPKPARRK